MVHLSLQPEAGWTYAIFYEIFSPAPECTLMPVVMFWNLKQGKAAPHLGAVCSENNVDILILAESGNLDLYNFVNQKPLSRPYTEYSISPSKVRFFTRLPIGSVVVLADEARASARLFRLPIGGDLLVIGVHLPSKINSEENERYYHARLLKNLIERSEREVGHSRTLVIGDFNMNPFDLPMIAPDGLHGMLDKRTAEGVSRDYVGVAHKFFYNPMWSRLGDESVGPSGTHWFNAGGVSNLYWNYYDQALIRPDLIPFYKTVYVITKIDDVELIIDNKMNAAISDHLPIVIHLDVEHVRS